MTLEIEDNKTLYRDSFGNMIDIGDLIMIAYRNELYRGIIEKVTPANKLRVKYLDKNGIVHRGTTLITMMEIPDTKVEGTFKFIPYGRAIVKTQNINDHKKTVVLL